MINRNSWAYKFGRASARFVLIGVGYLIGKKIWKKRPIDQGFPRNN